MAATAIANKSASGQITELPEPALSDCSMVSRPASPVAASAVNREITEADLFQVRLMTTSAEGVRRGS